MEALRTLFIMLFGFAVGIASSIVVMIYGWGVQPRSWPVILIVYLFGHLFAHRIIIHVGTKGK